MKLEVSKIRGETSYGMLCSEAELKLSDESEGIIELNGKFNSKIGKPYFNNSDKNNVIELSVTPNRPDCLGVRGIARDLAACDYGDFKDYKKIKFDKKIKNNLKVKIEKDKRLAKKIAKQAFEDIKLKYSWDIRAKKVLSKFEKINRNEFI